MRVFRLACNVLCVAGRRALQEGGAEREVLGDGGAVMWRRFLEIVSMSGDRGRGLDTVTPDVSDADVASRWVSLRADGFPCVREMTGGCGVPYTQP
jgi:hypothetical protein